MIREARLEDLKGLLALENECFVEPYNEEQLLYELKDNPVNKILVMEEENKLIGFIDYMVTFNSSTITQIGVTKEKRNKGYGSLLLKKMFELLPSIEDYKEDEDSIVETVTLEVRVSNLNAIKFYHKYGFEDITIKKHYYRDGEDAIYMLKRL